jgi:predicted RNA-binding protein with PUA-like domain
MKYWLMKSEASTWSWDEQVKKGGKDGWTGVRNHQAGNHMKAMAVGDRCFFYHSGDEKSVVGIVEVTKTWHPDPTDATGKFGMVCVESVLPLKVPVSLKQIKAEPRLADMVLVNNSRLSVQPVEPAAWKLVCQMGGVKA